VALPTTLIERLAAWISDAASCATALLLFLLGLVTGFIVPVMANPRAGLAAHLEGVINGMFLVVVGLTGIGAQPRCDDSWRTRIRQL
jgi:membrane associated rhomboid family serine protease